MMLPVHYGFIHNPTQPFNLIGQDVVAGIPIVDKGTVTQAPPAILQMNELSNSTSAQLTIPSGTKLLVYVAVDGASITTPSWNESLFTLAVQTPETATYAAIYYLANPYIGTAFLENSVGPDRVLLYSVSVVDTLRDTLSDNRSTTNPLGGTIDVLDGYTAFYCGSDYSDGGLEIDQAIWVEVIDANFGGRDNIMGHYGDGAGGASTPISMTNSGTSSRIVLSVASFE